MLKILRILALFSILAASLSSCLTVEEYYSIKPNGSGSMKYKIDMSEVASLLKMASEAGEENPLEGNQMDFVKEFADKLKGVEGISKVVFNEDKENYIFEAGFDFKNLDALGRAMASLGKGAAGGLGGKQILTQDGKTFTHHSMMPAEGLNFGELLGDDEESQQAAFLMGSMTYKLHFKSKKPIRAVYASGDIEFLDEKHKEVVIKTSFKEIMDNPDALKVSLITK